MAKLNFDLIKYCLGSSVKCSKCKGNGTISKTINVSTGTYKKDDDGEFKEIFNKKTESIVCPQCNGVKANKKYNLVEPEIKSVETRITWKCYCGQEHLSILWGSFDYNKDENMFESDLYDLLEYSLTCPECGSCIKLYDRIEDRVE